VSILANFLEHKIKLALGCTEPIAVALATSYARSLVEGDVRKIEVLVDPNIFKNGMGAGIPGTNGGVGNILAAALGALCGDPTASLEVLKNVDKECINIAQDLMDKRAVVIEVLRGTRGIFIDARVITNHGIGRARIEGEHTNLTVLERNGENVLDSTDIREATTGDKAFFDGVTFANLVSATENLNAAQIAQVIDAIEVNERAAEFGLSNPVGLKLGVTLQKAIADGLLGNDAANQAKMLTAAAVDARMGGASIPVMAVSGSGNQGIACTLPLLAFCRARGIKDQETLASAAALAFLVTGFIKEHIGGLGAMCGCVVAAGAGAAAGIVRLMGGDGEACARSVTNVLADLTGVICDGAKGGCSLKLATAANAAVQSAVLAMEGLQVTKQDGFIAGTIDVTVDNLGYISCQGMTTTDQVILDIMSKKLKAGDYSG